MNNFHRLLRYYCYRCLYEYNNNIDEEEGFLLLPAFLENLLVEGSTRSTRTRPTTKFPYRSFPQPDTNVARIYGRGVFIILSAFPLPPSPLFASTIKSFYYTFYPAFITLKLTPSSPSPSPTEPSSRCRARQVFFLKHFSRRERRNTARREITNCETITFEISREEITVNNRPITIIELKESKKNAYIRSEVGEIYDLVLCI